MLTKKNCLTCGKEFISKSDKNVYCCRSHFKKAYYYRRRLIDLNKKKFPSFVCPSCRKMIDLDFDPLVDNLKWTRFECPFCRTLVVSVFESITTQDESIKE